MNFQKLTSRNENFYQLKKIKVKFNSPFKLSSSFILLIQACSFIRERGGLSPGRGNSPPLAMRVSSPTENASSQGRRFPPPNGIPSSLIREMLSPSRGYFISSTAIKFSTTFIPISCSGFLSSSKPGVPGVRQFSSTEIFLKAQYLCLIFFRVDKQPFELINHVTQQICPTFSS